MASLAHFEVPAARALQREEKVRKLLLDAYGYDETKPDNGENGARILAAECGARLFNVLFTVRNPTELTGYSAIMDLTVNLNGNAFWAKHGPVLMPLLHMALSAQADYATLLLEKQQNPTLCKDDELRAECKLVGLELFSMIAFLLSGQILMQQCSLTLKRQLGALLG